MNNRRSFIQVALATVAAWLGFKPRSESSEPKNKDGSRDLRFRQERESDEYLVSVFPLSLNAGRQYDTSNISDDWKSMEITADGTVIVTFFDGYGKEIKQEIYKKV